MANSRTAPSINLSAFNCPYCGAYSGHEWMETWCDPLGDAKTPDIDSSAKVTELHRFVNSMRPSALKNADLSRAERESICLMKESVPTEVAIRAYNLHLSRCRDCRQVAVWRHKHLVFPLPRVGVEPSADMPAEVRDDFDEARTILNDSPRGAAALLRLCVEKLCSHLGRTEKNLDDKIAALVKAGLSIRVQQALDVVRVIGNNAVHPGRLDLRDDRPTAESLLTLVNRIVEQTISEPKQTEAMFAALPVPAKKAIEKRDRQP